jgi:hypothetical protein
VPSGAPPSPAPTTSGRAANGGSSWFSSWGEVWGLDFEPDGSEPPGPHDPRLIYVAEPEHR